MKAPGFWYSGNSALGALLSPLGLIYGMATACRQKSSAAVDVGVPVVCVGNLVAGGSGKTPVVIDLLQRLAATGKHPHVISRGYGGGHHALPHRVDPAADGASAVGDEPLLIAAHAPVWVCVDRTAAAKCAVADGADILVLDDGYQDPSLAKSLSLVVVDGRYGFGNGFMIPAGPLRETIAAGLGRADALVVMGEDTWGVGDAARRFGPQGLPVLSARAVPGPEIAGLTEGPLLPFAGIGHPEKFFKTLAENGCRLSESRSFADHHAFSASDLESLQARAAALNARLVTTEKDIQRIPRDRRGDIEVLTITLEWDDEAALERVLNAH